MKLLHFTSLTLPHKSEGPVGSQTAHGETACPVKSDRHTRLPLKDTNSWEAADTPDQGPQTMLPTH
jgi:hypothetical protein